MVIDCDRCEVRGDACGDCVVGVLLGVPGVPPRAAEPPSSAGPVHLDGSEQRALSVLADQGLVPRLRLVAAPPHGELRGGRAGRDRDVG